MEEQIFFGVINSENKKVDKKTLKLTATQLILDSIEIELKDLDMVCVDQAGMACDVKEFQQKNEMDFKSQGDYIKDFIKENGLNEENTFVVGMKISGKEQTYIIGDQDKAKAEQMREKIRNMLNQMRGGMKLEEIPDDIHFGNSFDLVVEKNGEVHKGQFTFKKKVMSDSKQQEILKYSEIQNMEEKKCNVQHEKVELSGELKQEKQDPGCCVVVATAGGKVTICHNVYGCSYEVKRFARFLRIECFLQSENKPDSRVRPLKETLEKDFKNESELGRWEGWAYVYGVSNLQLQNKYAFYLVISREGVLVQLAKHTDDLLNLSILQYYGPECQEGQVCDYLQYAAKKAKIGDFEMWLVDTQVKEESQCIVLENNKKAEDTYIFCIYNEGQVKNVLQGLKMAKLKREMLNGLQDYEPLAQGSQFNIRVQGSGALKEGKGKVEEKEVSYVQEGSDKPQRLIKYKEIQPIHGDNCEILIVGFKPEKDLKDEDPGCCLQYQYNKKRMTGCVVKDDLTSECKTKVKELAVQMRQQCLKERKSALPESSFDYNEGTYDDHENGVWRGWVKVAPLKGDVPKVQAAFLDLDAQRGTLTLKTQGQDKVETIRITYIELLCKAQGPCKVADYALHQKQPKVVEQALKQAKAMAFEDEKHCVILTTLQAHHKHPARLLCIIDLNQEDNLMLAIDNAYTIVFRDGDASYIPPADEGTVYQINYFNAEEMDPDKQYKNYEMSLGHGGLVNTVSKKTFLKHYQLEDMKGVKCGLEFRNIPLSPFYKEKQFNGDQCFNFYKGKGKELQKSTICVDSRDRPIVRSRRLMKKMKELCIKAKIELGQADGNDLKNLESHDKGDNSVLGQQAEEGGETGDDQDQSTQSETGDILFYQLESQQEVKNKGIKGYIETKDKKVKLSSHKDFKESEVEMVLLELHFSCKGPDICSVDNFLMQREKQMKQLEYLQLRGKMEKFMVENAVKDREQCFILEKEDGRLFYLESVVICSLVKDKQFINNARQKILNQFEQGMKTVELGSEDFKRYIPNIEDDQKWDIKVYVGKADSLTERKVMFKEYFIQGRDETDQVLRYDQIDYIDHKCQVAEAPAIDTDKLEGVSSDCCLQVISQEKEIIYCPKHTVRCHRQKRMMQKKLIVRCEQLNLNKDKAKKNGLFGKEAYSFKVDAEGQRVDKKDPDLSSKIDLMIEDNVEDLDNGVYEGWVMASDITDRDFTSKMHYNYLTVNTKHIAFRSTKGAEGYMEFKTSDMHYACQGLQDNCSLMEYLGHQIDSGVSFEAQHVLTKLNKLLLAQLPSEDPANCIVLEFQDPIIRSVRSVAVCLFRIPLVQKLHTSLNNAFYVATKEADVMLSFPLISLDNEVFPVKIFDEGIIIKENIIFEERGVYKYNKNKSLRKLLLEFEDIMPDKAGKTCAFWYRGLTVPDELEEKDPNCCINYKKEGKKDVYVCSTHGSRCIYYVKMLLKRMRLSCLDLGEGRKKKTGVAGGLQGVDGQSTDSGYDYSLGLYNEAANGVWKGRAYFYQLFKDTPLSDAVQYVEVMSTGIFIYDTQDEHTRVLLNKFKLVNQQIVCFDQEETCTVEQLEEKVKGQWEPKQVLEFKGQIKDIEKRVGEVKVKQECSGMLFKETVEEQVVNGTVVLCAQMAEQNQPLRKSLGLSYDQASRTIDIHKDVPMASLQQHWTVDIMDNEKGKITPNTVIQLGKKAIIDINTGTKIVKYSQIEADQFNNTCSFYYKNIELSPELVESGVNRECCFVFRLAIGEQTYCNAHKFHCIFSTLQLLKSLKQGCVSAGKGGLELAEGEQMVEEKKEDEMKEILGLDQPPAETPGDAEQKHKAVTGRQYWNLTEFEQETGPGAAVKLEHTTKENSTIEEEERVWKGWMWVTEVTKVPSRVMWVEVDKSGIIIKEDIHSETTKYELNYNYLKVICQDQKNTLCHLEPFVDKVSDSVDFEHMDEVKIAKDVEMAGVQAGGNQFCRVGLFKIPKEKPLDFGKTLNEKQNKHKFKDYKSQVMLFCTIQVEEHYIITFNTIVITLWEFMIQVFEINLMVESYSGEQYDVEIYQGGKASEKVVTVNHEKMLELSTGATVLEFNKASQCNYCYYLVQEVNELKSEKNCCFKLSVDNDKVIICSKDSFFCVAPMKRLVKTAFQGCLLNYPQGDFEAITMPIPCGTAADYLQSQASDLAESFVSAGFDEKTAISMATAQIVASQQSMKKEEEAFSAAMMQQAQEQMAAMVAQMAAMMADMKSKQAVSMQQTEEGMLAVNSDGSQTLKMADGSSVTTQADGTEIAVSASGAVSVKSDAMSAQVSASGAMQISSASGMAMSMSASGAVSMAQMTASGALAQMSISASGAVSTHMEHSASKIAAFKASMSAAMSMSASASMSMAMSASMSSSMSASMSSSMSMSSKSSSSSKMSSAMMAMSRMQSLQRSASVQAAAMSLMMSSSSSSSASSSMAMSAKSSAKVDLSSVRDSMNSMVDSKREAAAQTQQQQQEEQAAQADQAKQAHEAAQAAQHQKSHSDKKEEGCQDHIIPHTEIQKNSKECGATPKETGSVVESEDIEWKQFIKKIGESINMDNECEAKY